MIDKSYNTLNLDVAVTKYAYPDNDGSVFIRDINYRPVMISTEIEYSNNCVKITIIGLTKEIVKTFITSYQCNSDELGIGNDLGRYLIRCYNTIDQTTLRKTDNATNHKIIQNMDNTMYVINEFKDGDALICFSPVVCYANNRDTNDSEKYFSKYFGNITDQQEQYQYLRCVIEYLDQVLLKLYTQQHPITGKNYTMLITQ